MVNFRRVRPIEKVEVKKIKANLFLVSSLYQRAIRICLKMKIECIIQKYKGNRHSKNTNIPKYKSYNHSAYKSV